MSATPAALSDLDAAALLDDIEAFEAALEAGGGPIAVVGPPFAGRRRVLDHAASALDVSPTRLDPSTDRETLIGEGPLVVDDCQHLYDRRVGGFEPLTDALDALAGTSTPVVTGWNAHAWSYLDAARNVEDVFTHVFSVRKLPSDELATFVRERSTTLPTFRHDDPDADLLTVKERSLGNGGLTVPIPVVDRDRLRALFEATVEPETAVFDHLTDAADGNPGVALALWERGRSGGEMRPNDVDPPTVDLDHRGAFLLRIVLSQGVVDERALADRFGNALERPLGRLDRADIVTRADGTVRLDPVGVPAAVAVTEQWGFL
ncbi:hypothetical protein [Natronomonas amylolytica]|uniref:hypothetical protein n=1 Tax=Natronomonas amylolytica TaxID=3108498 RepID=UPI00300A7CAC